MAITLESFLQLASERFGFRCGLSQCHRRGIPRNRDAAIASGFRRIEMGGAIERSRLPVEMVIRSAEGPSVRAGCEVARPDGFTMSSFGLIVPPPQPFEPPSPCEPLPPP
jgi:hypothetical protein